jgi:hypothetical protein
VVGRLGQLGSFGGGRLPLGEGAALGQGGNEVTAGKHRGQSRQPEALLQERAVEARHILLEALHRPTIVPKTPVDTSQVVLRRHHEAHIPQSSGDRQGALPSREGAVWITHLGKMGEQIDQDPPQPVLVSQGLGEHFSFL